jgi:hypothetical protein
VELVVGTFIVSCFKRSDGVLNCDNCSAFPQHLKDPLTFFTVGA